MRAAPEHDRLVLGLALLGVAAGLLGLGANLFVDNARGLAAGLGVTGLAVGLLLAGAEPEELVTAVIASARGHPELAVAALVGSVTGNATATLGVAALVQPLEAGGTVTAAWVAAGLSVLLLVPLNANRRRARTVGALLLGSYVLFVVLALRA